LKQLHKGKIATIFLSQEDGENYGYLLENKISRDTAFGEALVIVV